MLMLVSQPGAFLELPADTVLESAYDIHFEVYLILLFPVLTHHMLGHDATLVPVLEGPDGHAQAARTALVTTWISLYCRTSVGLPEGGF